MTFEEVLLQNGKLAYTNVGVSMMPMLREGRDLMMIESCDPKKLRPYDVVLFRRRGITGRGAYVLHRILKVLPNGKYWIVGDNCTSGESVAAEDILGVLTQVKRDGGKTIRVSDFSYRIYVLFWCRPYRMRFLLLKARRLMGKIKRKLFNS
jgi:hypothetical protein